MRRLFARANLELSEEIGILFMAKKIRSGKAENVLSDSGQEVRSEAKEIAPWISPVII